MDALVVDDSDDIRALVQRVLAREGVRAEEAPGGVEALERLHRPPVPDVIVLDVQMPEMDGWEVLRSIRTEPGLRDIPVVMMTVKDRLRDVGQGWELGCDAYVTKPFDLDLLAETILAVLHRRPGRRIRSGAGETR